MKGLNLPDHGVEIRHAAEGDLVFDPVRRKWLLLTPEEWGAPARAEPPGA
jgi:hypothetical protein